MKIDRRRGEDIKQQNVKKQVDGKPTRTQANIDVHGADGGPGYFLHVFLFVEVFPGSSHGFVASPGLCWGSRHVTVVFVSSKLCRYHLRATVCVVSG